MKIIVDSNYCVISIECDEEQLRTKMTIDMKKEMSLTSDERKKVEA